jgi:DNA relaxase NicK
MDCLIDWFSFTFPVRAADENGEEISIEAVLMAFYEHTNHAFLGVVTPTRWHRIKEVGFYRNRIQCPKTKMTISWSGGNNYALCELSGTSCGLVRDKIPVSQLAKSAMGRATRIDLAVDIDCAISPVDFVGARGETPHKTTGSFVSETGITCYLGSRAGSRMARVYRYSPPHPRSHLLRIEVENKGDGAKAVCALLEDTDLRIVTMSANLPFAWLHEVWQPDLAAAQKIPARSYKLKDAGTLKWLNETVAPAIKKADTEGIINLHDWLYEHFGINP